MIISPKKVLIVEGIYSLFDAVIRDILSVRCFLDVPCDIRFIRRLERDTKEREEISTPLFLNIMIQFVRCI